MPLGTPIATRPDLHEVVRNAPEAHVVPIGDTLDHYVPGDGDRPGTRQCECCPSVLPVRHELVAGRAMPAVGLVLVHHAQDERVSGDYAGAR